MAPKMAENEIPIVAEGKSGVKRGSSQNIHRRFPTVASYVSELGGDKGIVIEKVLIANNGVAAIKAIRSIRRWAYDVFGDERKVKFVVMATPEDLRSNAEYIRMGDVIVDVPGGSNNHNYANVTLIVELARLHGVHAVWAGWGHASENPILPDTLANSNPPIKFIGPAGPPMRALGDKIGSTIIAQSAGVPCIGWNGADVEATYDRATGSLPEEAYDKASIANATEAFEAATKIGFPVMIKASEGGGGKGIRMVDNAENVQTAFRQVCGEVPGSPIFIMKLSKNSRHLEVQLLADEYGDAIALNGRDCSVQRRHQKIIEEGPPVAAAPDVWLEMENAAVALAKAVGYTNAGTVEYLYSEEEKKFYFLELNPRLQVEHPVTEMITGANLPAAQLQVAMGIPLRHIPEIRELYGKNRFEDVISDETTMIDFATTKRNDPTKHCIAVRITAENAEAGFKPTSGGIQELNFRSTPNVWGYFSMDSSGAIHEFADSQFGHLFASGDNREQARRNMVLALKELSIRGDISTTVDYISKLIELNDFVDNNIDTSWLDGIIKDNIDGIAEAAPKGSVLRRSTSVAIKSLDDHTYAALGATILAFDRCSSGEEAFLESLGRGQLPPQNLISMVQNVELILNETKYKLVCTRLGPHKFAVAVVGDKEKFVSTNIRVLSDGGYLIDAEGKSHVAYVTSKGDSASGMRMSVGGVSVAFSPDYDPTSLRTDVAGKLVKKLVPDGAHLKKGEPYAEIEVMKMFMPLKVEETGILTWCNNEGATLAPGDLLATLELDNPENVSAAVVFEGCLRVDGLDGAASTMGNNRAHLLFRKALGVLTEGMCGYVLIEDELSDAMENIYKAATDPSLPVFEIDEQLSVLSGRLDANLFQTLSGMVSDFKQKYGDGSQPVAGLRFPASKVEQLISDYSHSIKDPAESVHFSSLTTPLREAAAPYIKSSDAEVVGSERALNSFLQILRNWISVERWFCNDISYADAVENLRKANKESSSSVLNICRSHAQLKATSKIILRIIETIADGSRVESVTGKSPSVVAGAAGLDDALPCLSDIASMGGKAYAEVALAARKLLLHESLHSVEDRKSRVSQAAQELKNAAEKQIPKEVQHLLDENVPLSDVFFSLLNASADAQEEIALAELYARKMYRTYSLRDVKHLVDQRTLKFSFTTKQTKSVFSSTTPMTSMSDLSRALSRSSSLSNLDMTKNESESDLTSLQKSDNIPPNTVRTVLTKIVGKVEDLKDPAAFENVLQSFPQFTMSASKCEAGPINILYFVVQQEVNGTLEEMDAMSKCLQETLEPFHDLLKQADIRRVAFFVQQKDGGDMGQFSPPAVFTYRAQSGFKEDSLFRNIEPSFVYQLDLGRLAKNFSVKRVGVHQTTTSHVHMYKATPRTSALANDKKANKSARVFGRAVSFVDDFSSASCERTLVDAMNAFDLCGSSGEDNHLFMNLESDYEKVTTDPVELEQTFVSILKRHGERVARLGIAEVEIRVLCCVAEGCPPISLRLVASNPTGYVLVMNTYVEAADETGTKGSFKLIGGTKANLACSGDSSWEGMDVTSPYPLTRPFDAQRKAALKASDTLYCYDLPALFEAAVEKQWNDASSKGGIEGGIRAASKPLMVMYTSELVVQKKKGDGSKSWTMKDYLNGDLELVQMSRGAGANDVGMVAWLMILKTVEYPEGRQVILIANDITHKAGSFGTREDVVFKLASEYARERRIPRLYVAANSGARIGLAEGVKKAFKVAFKDPLKPENGFNFIYVTKDDYERFGSSKKEIIAEPVTLDGEEVYKVTDIIGAEPDLGVENLKGSGLIAGETSSAYNDIFTMTIVLGRTVGIGAYLVRLGQRTIQKADTSPIILTGYQALNKLMGVDVYSTNDQLGGPGIMYSNGVSHLVAPDHLQAVSSAIEWLSFVPSVRNGLLPITDIRGIDEIERPIEFTPTAGIPYDPRLLLTGGENDDGVWQSGFFDKGSFTESLSGWAKSVVVGRARLGGIPMGVVATENRTAEAIKPADPADVKGAESITQEAGCVWFPNSAYKTAQAINDFRTEDLPLMIFANWRGFSGGQRDMFDEVLKYGSLIVDAFVAYEQPIFVFIPPFAEIRGGAWVVLDASINASVMEMYATSGSARGGVLEANGAASVKYRTKDLLSTMHRLDDTLKSLDKKLSESTSDDEKKTIKQSINEREQSLIPVYEQIAVQFCELHDTPGRMEAVGVIEKSIEWKEARSFFFWRLRRKLAEFDFRKKIQEASSVGSGFEGMTAIGASALMKTWFIGTPGMTEDMWNADKAVLSWMAQCNQDLERKLLGLRKQVVIQEVVQAMTAGGATAEIGTAGIVEGICQVYQTMSMNDKEKLKKMLKEAIDL